MAICAVDVLDVLLNEEIKKRDLCDRAVCFANVADLVFAYRNDYGKWKHHVFRNDSCYRAAVFFEEVLHDGAGACLDKVIKFVNEKEDD